MRGYSNHVGINTRRGALGISFLMVGALLSGFIGGSLIPKLRDVFAFSGPPSSPGIGGGAILVDGGNNLSLGTSTVLSNTRLLIYSTSTESTRYAIRIFNKSEGPLFHVRNDGKVAIGTNTFGVTSTLVVAGEIQSTSGGIRFPDNTVQTTAASGGGATINAANVEAGDFGANTGGGNYSFPASVGIGTTTPFSKLDVWTTTGSNAIRIMNSSVAGDKGWSFYPVTSGTDTDLRIWEYATTGSGDRITLKAGGNVGIGTTMPETPLHVSKTGLSQIKVQSTDVTTNSAASLATYVDSGFIFFGSHGSARTVTRYGLTLGGWSEFTNFNNTGTSNGLVIGTNPAVPLVFGTNNLERVRIDSSGNVGIGTPAPSYKLDVVSGGVTTARFGTINGDTVIVGGGAGKINVGTVDPIYTIGGKKYATYLPGMTGQKEETAGIIRCEAVGDGCEKKIDFRNLEEGSDLWLFAKITSLTNNFDKLTVLLTPAFNGRAWYEKNETDKTLTLHALLDARYSEPNSTLEISYRLTAPRFDSAVWTNYNYDEGVSGFVIE